VRRTFLIAASLAAAACAPAIPAAAASLLLTADAAVYAVGETIRLDLVATIDEADRDGSIFGRLTYDPRLADTLSSSQQQLSSSGQVIVGGEVVTVILPWTLGPLEHGDGFVTLLDQTRLGSSGVDQTVLLASALLYAEAPGVLDLRWIVGAGSTPPFPSLDLDFFGVTNHPGVSVRIVPEPSTALLIALGLAGLVIGRRRSPG